MTVAEFKKKWLRYKGKETSAYQEHFNDLCDILGQKTPAEADPSGSDWFCFQKRVVKDQELFAVEEDEPEASERGFADVWRKGCFAWEYKGKRKNLDEAYKQLLRYRESLLNPPLLVVCDFERFIVRTNFNGTVQETYEFDLTHLDEPRNWRVLRALFSDPESLKPVQTTAEVTEALAGHIAEIAKSLQKREAVELTDAKTRAEMNFAQRKNLRIARFLNRLVFCFFAEDTGLLPPDLFSNLLKLGLDDPHHLATTMENLFAVMADGGTFGKDKIRHFNGHLFEEATVFELTDDELRKLAEAGEYSWQFIEPSIMGTLFERALEPEQRSQLGAHYTSEADIKTLVEPVLMAPLRREWAALKGTLAAAYVKGKGTPAQRDELAAFQKKLAATTVLDPACGSGNFLYVSLQLLLGLEKEVLAYATQLGCKLAPKVGVQQLRALEINPSQAHSRMDRRRSSARQAGPDRQVADLRPGIDRVLPQAGVRRLAMQTLYVDNINDGPDDYATLFDLARDVASTGWRAKLDFTCCTFLRQNAVAFLGGLARMAHHHGGQLEFDWPTLQDAVAANLAQNGFMHAFRGSRKGWNGNSIPFHADDSAKAHEFGTYLRDRWIGRGWVSVSPALADHIVGNVAEVYVNAFEHAASPVGITCCGQHYPKKKQLKLTLVDFGVGIPTKVRTYMQKASVAPLWTPASCMQWAFQRGTSTKPGAGGGPCGLGLDLLLSFVRLNGGNLEMFSHEGHALITPDSVQFSTCASFFPGTLVTISLICDEEYYCLKSELPGPALF